MTEKGILRSSVVAAALCACEWLGAPVVRAGTAQQAPPETRRTAVVTPITSGIVVDGSLDEAVWGSAPKIGDLIQRQPDTGQPPTERTEVTLLHDANNLYIGVMCYDSEPDRVIGTQMARDAALGSDDRLEIVLDTFRDQRNAFYFATNPSGALVDGLAFANGQSNNEWDAIWDVRTRRTSQGWVAEFAIPFKSLSFPSERTVWGFNIARFIQRKLEDNRWSAARLELQFLQVSEAGEITNLNGLTQGIGLDVRPFLGGRWLHLNRANDDQLTGKPGVDLFYNFTPSLKLSATVNTDFGETEVDARQINLSRFSLLFPEKRAFFLEDAGVFSFSSSGVTQPGGVPPAGAEVFPFFSRQVGLLSGEEVPIDVGVKLTGKAGRTDVGLLDVRTRDVDTAPDRNFFVGRVRRNILQQSYIGAVYTDVFTDGSPLLSRVSRTLGADVRLATSRFLGASRNLVFNAYTLRTFNDDATTARGCAGVSSRRNCDWSHGLSVQYPNDKYLAQFTWRDIQENFRPAVGFVQRRNVRLMRVGASFNPRPRDLLGIQQMNHDVFFTRFTRLDTGEVESWDLHTTLLDWHFKSGDNLHSVMDANPIYERLFAPFTIFPGVVLRPGEYKFTRWRFSAMSAAKRNVQGTINYSFGNFWSGKGETLVLGFTYKMPPNLTITLNANHTFARLPEGDFTARILSAQGNYSVSPLLSFSNLLQYDNVSRNMGLQSRVRWTLRPGNDVFFVFSQGWIEDLDNQTQSRHRFRTEDSKVSAKIQYTSRF